MCVNTQQEDLNELCLTRVWEPVSSDLVWTVVLRVLRPGGHPHVRHPAGRCGRPHGNGPEASRGQD